jgi:hypothetical protein
MDKHQDEIFSGSWGFHNYCREVENNSNGAHSMIPSYILFIYLLLIQFSKEFELKELSLLRIPRNFEYRFGNGGIYAEHLSFTVPGDCNPRGRRSSKQDYWLTIACHLHVQTYYSPLKVRGQNLRWWNSDFSWTVTGVKLQVAPIFPSNYEVPAIRFSTRTTS